MEKQRKRANALATDGKGEGSNSGVGVQGMISSVLLYPGCGELTPWSRCVVDGTQTDQENAYYASI